MKRILKNRQFQIAFSFTIIIIMMFSFMVIADFRCRQLTFNDSSPVIAFQKTGAITYANVDLFGVSGKYDVSNIADLWYGFADFICFPHK